jgi:hypothetical protein
VKNSFPLVSKVPTIGAFIAGTVLISVFIYLVLISTRVQKNDQGINRTSIADCVAKFGASTKQIQELSVVNNFCYYYVAYQLQADEGIIRRDNYLFQRNENVVLMYMVVLITFMGVVLAGVQLLASYKLAVLDKGALETSSEIQYSHGGASLKSSVIGLAILALSFAFFLVFVFYVYNFRPEQLAASAPSSSAPNVGRIINSSRPISSPPATGSDGTSQKKGPE